jgi:hypothetical protein
MRFLAIVLLSAIIAVPIAAAESDAPTIRRCNYPADRDCEAYLCDSENPPNCELVYCDAYARVDFIGYQVQECFYGITATSLFVGCMRDNLPPPDDNPPICRPPVELPTNPLS